jgi:hypothetical protein
VALVATADGPIVNPCLRAQVLRLFPVLVTSPGLLALLGWLVGTPTLANLGASGVPMVSSAPGQGAAFEIHLPRHAGG